MQDHRLNRSRAAAFSSRPVVSPVSRQGRRMRPLVLAMAAASLVSALPELAVAQALPTGMTVVQGQASANTAGNTMTVTNSAGAVLNWSSFSIGSGQTVRFQQPSASSQVLNRVVGNDPSQIFGNLSSNGKVWLLNPNGVLFGADARIDVAGFVASTLNLADSDWAAGRYRFTAVTGARGDVVNDGEIRTPLGGRVMLLSSNDVTNRGLIDAPSGQVVLAAGQSIEVVDTGAPNIALNVTAPQGQALNLGTVSAAGGRIDVQAGIVNQQGLMRADGVSGGAGGSIVLSGNTVNLATASTTRASGASGGFVQAQAAGGTTLVDGAIDVSGSAGSGGNVRLLGRQVGLTDHASVQASGASGGGTVLVGGGAQGRDASVPNAESTYMSGTAAIHADATANGDGGHVVLWGDVGTRAYGSFSARGGAQGGNGGLIETSGGWLDSRPVSVDVRAPAGKAGTLLLDPNDVTITATSIDTNVTGAPNFTTTGDSALISTDTLDALLNNGTNVTITTGSAGTNAQAGDVTFASSVGVAPNVPVSLTVNAQHDIIATGVTIGSSGAAMSVNLLAGQGGSGTVNLNTGRIATNGGSFTSTGNFQAAQFGIDTGGGAMQITAPNFSLGLFSSLGSGTVNIHADTVNIDSTSSINSGAVGDGIVIQGASSNFVNSFTNASSASLNVAQGRWLVYASNPGVVSDGGLIYNFVVYGGPAPGTPLPDTTNNGFIYNVSPTLTLGTTSTPTKVYDQSTFISLASNGVSVTGGLINGDTASISSNPSDQSGNFSDPNAGTGKAIAFNPAALFVSDSQGRTVYGYQVTGLSGNITPRLVSAGGTTSNKVYDGTTAATVSGWSVVGLLTGDAVTFDPGTATFSDRNVGTGKSITTSAALTGAQAGNYTLAATASPADITPRPVTITGTASDKVYDGTTAASVAWSIGGLVAGDNLAVSATPANFSDPNVGTNKTVAASGVGLSGSDVGNYTLVGTSLGTASITPATLTYTAAPVQLTLGQVLPSVFDGTVTGFVGGDTLATATTGSAVFVADASSPPPVGTYAIDGTGLTAANYVFAQADGNATALRVIPLTVNPGDPSTVALGNGIQAVQPTGPAPGSPGVVDGFQAMQPNPQTGQVTFTAQPYGTMSPDSVGAVLSARNDYKQSIFANAISELEKNPGMADLPGCETAEQLNTGNCLLTDKLKRQLEAQGGGKAEAVASAQPANGAIKPPTPAAPTSVPKPVAATPLLGKLRPVKTAALPEIRRKVAVVIGINGYGDRQIPRLDNAVNDAQALGKTFGDALGYETVLLTDASRETIVATLNRLALTLKPQDSVVVYYAGHGELVPSTGLGYWLPSNADSQNPRSWLSNADIGKLLGQFDASQIALISDSCYSGSLVGNERIGPTTQSVDPRQLLSRRTAVAMSSGGNEPVADSGKQGHSPFAWSLMQSLNQLQGWQPGGNVFERVRFAVARELPQRPKYGAAPFSGHEAGSDYLFERRQLGSD